MAKTIYPDEMQAHVIYVDNREKSRGKGILNLFREYDEVKNKKNGIIIKDVVECSLAYGDYAYCKEDWNDPSNETIYTIGVEYKSWETLDARESFFDHKFERQLEDMRKEFDFSYGVIQGCDSTDFRELNVFPKLSAKGYQIISVPTACDYFPYFLDCSEKEFVLFKYLETLFNSSGKQSRRKKFSRSCVVNSLSAFNLPEKAIKQLPKIFLKNHGTPLTPSVFGEITYEDLIQLKGVGDNKAREFLAMMKFGDAAQ